MPSIITRIIHCFAEAPPYLRQIAREEEAEKEITCIRSEVTDLLENTKKELKEYERANAQEERNFNLETPAVIENRFESWTLSIEGIKERLNSITKLSENIRRRNRVHDIQEYVEHTEGLLDELQTSVLNIADAPPTYRHTVLLPPPPGYQEALLLLPPPTYKESQKVLSIEKKIRQPYREITRL